MGMLGNISLKGKDLSLPYKMILILSFLSAENYARNVQEQ